MKITCQICKREFEVKPFAMKKGRKFCSPNCYWQAMKNRHGKNTPNWRGGMIKVFCKKCGKIKSYYPNVFKKGWGSFCSQECHYGSINKICNFCKLVFSTHKLSKKRFCSKSCAYTSRGAIMRKCKICPQIIKVYKYETKIGKGNFCSRECYGKWRTENIVRERNHQWLNGKSFEPYGVEFNHNLREHIRKRDAYKCQNCHVYQDNLYSKTGRKYKLHIHHIDYNKLNNNPNNLISLCNSCHMRTNHNRDIWMSHYKNKIWN